MDRDMLLRYHWGLGVGHAYSHLPGPSDENHPLRENCSVVQDMLSPSSMSESPPHTHLGTETTNYSLRALEFK
jgi:hypothetical protein